jgi:glycosyltransferase involved in cell wall biosynthesis
MKVLLDALGIENQKTGVSQYSLRLVENMAALAPQLSFQLLIRPGLDPVHPLRAIAAAHPNVALRATDIPAIGLRRDLRLPALLRGLSYDLYHCLSSNLPLRIAGRSLVTIHDLKYVLYPEYLGRFRRLKSAYLRRLFAAAVRHAAAVITVSGSTRSDLLCVFPGLERELHRKVRVIPEASSIEKQPRPEVVARYGLEGPYFLYVGELRPHKNVDGLIRAFERLVSRYPVPDALRLLIVGKRHRSYTPPIGTSSRVVFTGYVEDGELYEFYRHALAYCLVSHYEGFGLPLLDAMDCGAPVITSRVSSMPEVAGDAALQVDPGDGEQIAQAMYRIISDRRLRGELIEKGRARAAAFSWRGTAGQTLELYRELANQEAGR